MQHTKTEIRERLLDAALYEFTAYGYDKANLRRIVNNADSSLGNLYRYYKNKEALYSAIVNPMIEVCVNKIALISFSAEKLTETAEVMIDFFIDRNQIFAVLQKGPYAYYNNFLLRLANAIAINVQAYVAGKLDGKVNNITNPDFNQVFAWSFINGMQRIMEHFVSKEITTKYIEELLFVMFDGLEDRLSR